MESTGSGDGRGEFPTVGLLLAGDENRGVLVEDKKSRDYHPEYLYGVPVGFPCRKCV